MFRIHYNTILMVVKNLRSKKKYEDNIKLQKYVL